MTLHRCYAEPGRWSGDIVALSPEESHHLGDVLRAAAGTPVEVLDGQGRVASGCVEAAPRGPGRGPRELRVRLSGPPRLATRDLRVTLVSAIPKANRFDGIVEKATELGAARIIPCQTARSVVRLAGREAEVRVERWRRLAISAAKQCGTPWLPEIALPQDWPAALAEAASADLSIIGSLEPGSRPLREVLAAASRPSPRRVSILIGPEGDFTPDEFAEARRAGVTAASFGPLVLRVDTAALYGLGAVACWLGG